VTTIKDTNSRVDFVWMNNDKELRRVEGISGKSTANNSMVHTDHYIISQLSTADNNTLYICEITINTNQLLLAIYTLNVTLNVIGKFNVAMYIN